MQEPQYNRLRDIRAVPDKPSDSDGTLMVHEIRLISSQTRVRDSFDQFLTQIDRPKARE